MGAFSETKATNINSINDSENKVSKIMLIIKKTKKEDIKKLSKIYKRAYDRPKFGEKWSIKNAEKLLNFYFKQKTFVGVTAFLDKKIVGGGSVL